MRRLAGTERSDQVVADAYRWANSGWSLQEIQVALRTVEGEKGVTARAVCTCGKKAKQEHGALWRQYDCGHCCRTRVFHDRKHCYMADVVYLAKETKRV